MRGLTHTSQTICGRHNVARRGGPRNARRTARTARFGGLTWVALKHTLTRDPTTPFREEPDERAPYARRNPQESHAPRRRRRRALGRVHPGLCREDPQGHGRPRRQRVLAVAASHTGFAQHDPRAAHRTRRRDGGVLGPAIDQHARPRDGDDAQDAVRPARRARHRFRHRLPDRRARHPAHRRRRDPARGDPRLQHRHPRLFQGPQRQADPGRGDPGAHAGRGDRGIDVRHQAAGRKGLHVRQRRAPAVPARQGGPRRPRPLCPGLRSARPRQRLRLRPAVAEMPRARHRADLPYRRPLLWRAQQPVELHLQPYRSLRRGRP